MGKVYQNERQFNQLNQNPGFSSAPPTPFDGRKSTWMVGRKKITVTPDIVKKYLVSGNPQSVTNEEIVYFINLCKAQSLDPFVRDAYLIKYSDKNPAQIVTGIGALEKRADTFPEYDGMKSGIVVISRGGNVQYRDGSMWIEGEQVIGGWAEVYRKDREVPTHVEVSFTEFAGRTKDGSLNSMWKSKPGTMIRKVAKSTALREAFPRQNAGLYGLEEVNATKEDEEFQPVTPMDEGVVEIVEENDPNVIEAEVVEQADEPAGSRMFE